MSTISAVPPTESMASWLFGPKAVKRLARLDSILRGQIEASYVVRPTVSDRLTTRADVLNDISSTYSSPESGSDLSVFDLAESGFKIFSSISSDAYALDIYGESIELVQRDTGHFGPLFDLLVDNIVPIKATSVRRRKKGVGFSSHLARNFIFMSVPEIPEFAELELAINIMHEVGHQALLVYQSCDPILSSDPKALIYSGIRRCHRPAILSFHGAVALAYMIQGFKTALLWPEYQSDRASEYIRERLKIISIDLVQTLVDLSKCQYTPLGKRLFQELAQVLA